MEYYLIPVAFSILICKKQKILIPAHRGIGWDHCIRAVWHTWHLTHENQYILAIAMVIGGQEGD